MKLIKWVYALWCLFLPVLLHGQDVPVPGMKQKQAIVIKEARIFKGTGEVIESGYMRFDQGMIREIGRMDQYSSREGEQEIDINGKSVYPGLIALESTLGLQEVGAVRATLDHKEVGIINPSSRSLIAYNTDSRIIPTVRSNGILLAQITPQGGLVSGLSSTVQLDAWNWEDAVVHADEGLWVRWPERWHATGWWGEPGPVKENKNWEKHLESIRDLFIRAKAYCRQQNQEVKNLNLDAICPCFDHRRKVYIEVNSAEGILLALNLFKTHELKGVLVGASDIDQALEAFKKSGVELILRGPHRLPDARHDPIDRFYTLAAHLEEQAISFALSMPGFWNQRNLAFQAGTAIAYGLSEKQALKSLTLEAAAILGIEQQYGSLEAGKSATFIVSSGSVFEPMEAKIHYCFIDGREVNLANRHKDLYQKFSGKYRQNEDQ